MRVLLVTSIERGGPIEQTRLLARGLAREGASVLVSCANAELAERFSGDGVRATVLPLRHQADVLGASRLWRLQRGVDVVHAQDRRAGLWLRIGPRPRRGGIRVYTAHGIPREYHPPPVGPVRPGLRATVLYRGLDRALCSRADGVIVPSRSVSADLSARLGYPRSRLTVIPNGVEPAPTGQPRGSLIGTLSVLEPFKGLDVFLRAAALLSARHPDWRYAMFGSGSQRDDLDRLAQSLEIGPRLHKPGFVAGPRALGRLAVYVLSSYWENAPMALLEAMAAGVPVVASAVDGVPEIVDDSCAQLVRAGDPAALAAAIERVRCDRALRDAQVAAARRRVQERFTAARNARLTLDLYELLLRGRLP
jgi:glycosyltransferase involved in cell wall biosynthesis